MVVGARLASSLAMPSTMLSRSSAFTTLLINPYSFAVSASIALPRIMKSSPCLLGISLNNPAMTMKGHIPLFISGAENLASVTATA